MNGLKTALLLGLMTALVLGIGNLVGGRQGMMFAFVIAAIMNFVSYWFSDKIVLALYRAQPVDQSQAPELSSIVQGLAQRMHMPMPRLFIIPTEAPNAFATGRNPEHAAVAVTEGIMRLLNREELEGVLAHELSHVSNRDILISSVAATLAGAIMMIARIAQFSMWFGGGGRDDNRGSNPLGLLLMAILAPIAAMLIQLAISRSREYAADETGARVIGHGAGLASALEKLKYASKKMPLQADPATAHLFIVKPFTGSTLLELFSTHPPLEKRIERLRQMPA
ncbi:zinc metalloprotease HtpX [bacterium]|nr:zinc metalloprotease HtpX [bacterium]MCI0612603.1 zinc metalloprotease HtpX [bacterium]